MKLHKDEASLKKMPVFELTPWHAFENVLAVLHMGAKKHGLGNWQRGRGDLASIAAIRNSLARHMLEYGLGQRIDPESGLPILAHLICNAMFLLEIDVEVKK